MTTIRNLIGTLDKFHSNHCFYETDGKNLSLTVFLHTSAVTCADCCNIISIIKSYKCHSFVITEETLSELRYLANNKQSIFHNEAKSLIGAFYKNYIRTEEYDEFSTQSVALVSPSLPYAKRMYKRRQKFFDYIVTCSDYNKVSVITSCDTNTASWAFESNGSVESDYVTAVADKVIYKGRKLKLSGRAVIEGGEASLYRLGRKKLIKQYRCGSMTDTKVAKLKSIMALADDKKKVRKIMCVPSGIVTDKYGKSTGIVIPRLKKYKTFGELMAKGMSNRKCQKLLRLYLLRIFELNLLSIVVSDVSEHNFMCHKNKVVLVDVDSFQVGKYPSGCYRQGCLTQTLHNNLKNIDVYIRGLEQDMISFCYMVFDLLVGVKPVRYRNSTEHSNFVTHPFIYLNKPYFSHPQILSEALDNWMHNLNDNQRDLFIKIFRENRYISPAEVDKMLFP